MPFITTDLEQAILDLQSGKPVAIPTETVYGLAAMITKPEAIHAVFSMKNRPLNHPLIVHIAQKWDLFDLVEDIPEYAFQLINTFWPGPLTLVFRARPNQIDPLITGGQSTVAIRCPAHPMTQALLEKLKTPVVAPSANPFGKISPTTALHVKHAFLEEELTILDGGRCTVGIESTIIDATHPEHYQILRHGLIHERDIAKATQIQCFDTENAIRVPGKLESHYQPEKPLFYFEAYDALERFCNEKKNVFVIASTKPVIINNRLFYPLSDKPEHLAFDLYYQLRKGDESNAHCIAIELPPKQDAWLGVRERILKAGHAHA